MSDRPRISIVVPFFDSGRTIRACIESLRGQRDVGGPYEIFMIDNGSSDDSASIAGEYSGLSLLSEVHPSAYSARNTGLLATSAPLIAFTDADCVVDAHWLRSILDGMREPRTAVLIGHCQYPDGSSTALRVLEAYENAKAEYVLSCCGPEHRFAYCNNMAVRASVLDEIGPFEKWQRAADTEFVHRLAARRPELRVVFRQSMRVTHLEFESVRSRARRLRLYSRTNSRIETFRELGLPQRLGVLGQLVRAILNR